ncbi:hypothetical protein NDU88_003004 [Pleurodeles waltl]|uniref:Uncharacterized protein n=1 Tax=Pleurodeles waltl TaxID=8319 RepID=A0AAV7T3V9_PLEWA|nr:hypothetical protein NDU88_003004 [Pleurodeles waltl]
MILGVSTYFYADMAFLSFMGELGIFYSNDSLVELCTHASSSQYVTQLSFLYLRSLPFSFVLQFQLKTDYSNLGEKP